MSDKEHDMTPRTVALEWWQNLIQFGLITLLQHFHRIYCMDSRSYYYRQYPGTEITYSFSKFMHTVPLGIVTNTHSESPTFVAGFGESMLLTWIGLATMQSTTTYRYILYSVYKCGEWS